MAAYVNLKTSMDILNSTVWRMESEMTMLRINDLTLDAIVQLLTQHFYSATIEIAKRFKFFKQNQKEDKSAMEYIEQL